MCVVGQPFNVEIHLFSLQYAVHLRCTHHSNSYHVPNYLLKDFLCLKCQSSSLVRWVVQFQKSPFF